MTLRTRLFLAVALIALVSVAVAFAIGAVLTRRTVERNTLKDVAAQAELLAQRQRESVSLPCRVGLGAFFRLQDERLLCLSLGAPTPYLSPSDTARLRRKQPVDGTVTVAGTRFFRAARVVKGGKVFVLLRPTDTIASAWRPHVEGLLIGAGAATLLAALAAFGLARAISGPVRRVAEASSRLVVEESPPTVPVTGPLELASLARSFNDMASQLTRAREAERDFLLSVSHELKTPLTAIRGYAEAMSDDAVPVDEAADTIRREAERLERLVRDLLDLARMHKSRFDIRREHIDLAAAAREAGRRYAPQASAFGVELEVEAPDEAPALGDIDRVDQAVSNLVENALRLTPAGGTVRIVAETGRLAVEDNGPGLKPKELDRAFERFFLYSRYGKERPVGTGLGLAIVKQLVEGMGGSVEVTSEPGRLTRFTLRLPRRPVASAADELVRA